MLMQSSRVVYDTWLNWDAWGKSASELIMDMLDARTPHADSIVSHISEHVAHSV